MNIPQHRNFVLDQGVVQDNQIFIHEDTSHSFVFSIFISVPFFVSDYKKMNQNVALS